MRARARISSESKRAGRLTSSFESFSLCVWERHYIYPLRLQQHKSIAGRSTSSLPDCAHCAYIYRASDSRYAYIYIERYRTVTCAWGSSPMMLMVMREGFGEFWTIDGCGMTLDFMRACAIRERRWLGR